MYCPHCGAENDDNHFRCVACGKGLRERAPLPVKVPNYLVQAILCTLFCCMPFGIVAVIYAAQATSKAQAGDLAGAHYSSEKARMWCWISFWVQAGAGLLWVLAAMMSGLLRGMG